MNVQKSLFLNERFLSLFNSMYFHRTMLVKGTFKNFAQRTAFFSRDTGSKKDWAGNKGISRLSFKISNILQRGLMPCFNVYFNRSIV